MAASWANTVFNWLGSARYNAAQPTVSNGQSVELQSDSQGNLRVNVAAQSATFTFWTDSTALGTNKIVKASAGTLWSLFGFNGGGATRYLMVFDSPTLPANGTVPQIQTPVPANATFSLDHARGRRFATGVTWAVSTTVSTLTLDTGGLFWCNGEWS